MDTYTNTHAEQTRQLRQNAEMKLQDALAQSLSAAREIAAMYSGSDLDLLTMIKNNSGTTEHLDAKSLMAVLVHRAALRQLFVDHDQRQRPATDVVT